MSCKFDGRERERARKIDRRKREGERGRAKKESREAWGER
jgi:hypothetical protein